jgi:guanylate kinase
MKNNINKGAVLVVSGPSGCGKSSLLQEVYKHIDNYYFSISTTTRLSRIGEKNGVDYNFVSKEEFEQDISDGQFLEYANVHNNYYGTSLKPIISSLKDGKLVIFDIDIQGHEIIKQKLNSITTSVFITTPNLTQLKQRLNSRGTDSNKTIQKRVLNAITEINDIDKYDYFIINDDLNEASNLLLSVAQVAQIKTKLFDKNNIIKNWSI